MVFVHLIYDLTALYGVVPWGNAPGFLILKNWGGTVFFLLSGLCATLGSRELKRGCLVFGCGILVSAVTGIFSPGTPIRFGVLHCLGLCMQLWHLLKRLPSPISAPAGAGIILLGFFFEKRRVCWGWLYPLGLTTPDFYSADYFPLIPYLGYFLLGAVLGRRFYSPRRSLLPRVDTHNPMIRFLLLCGRNSLIIYLGHQPVLMAVSEILF